MPTASGHRHPPATDPAARSRNPPGGRSWRAYTGRRSGSGPGGFARDPGGNLPGSHTPRAWCSVQPVPDPEAPVRSTLESVEPTKVRINVVVEPDELRPAIDRTTRRLSREVRVPGFRKGKVPRQVIEARIGREALLAEAIEQEAVPEFYAKAIEELGVTAAVAGPGRAARLHRRGGRSSSRPPSRSSPSSSCPPTAASRSSGRTWRSPTSTSTPSWSGCANGSPSSRSSGARWPRTTSPRSTCGPPTTPRRSPS